MHISALTGSQVWLSSSRSLTNIGSGALALTSQANTSVAGGASVDFRPSAGTLGIISVGVLTNAAATGLITIKLTDGSVGIVAAQTAAAASSPAVFTSVSTATVGMSITNADATHAGSYNTAAWVFTI